MQRLVIDPHTLVCPEYQLDRYAPVRRPLVEGGSNDQAAANQLRESWIADNALQREQWNEQVEADRLAEVALREQRDAEEEARRLAEEAEAEDARLEDKKKNKAKFIPVPRKPVPTTPVVLPSQYALHRLNRGYWVELWYFTNEGIAAASSESSSAEHEAMAVIQRSDGSHGLVAAPSTRASKFAIPDKDLQWEDFTHATVRYHAAIKQAGWPKDRCDMVLEFFTAILSHPFRFSHDPIDRRSLLTYQDEQRQLWHNNMTNRDTAYSLAEINPELLRSTRDRVYCDDRNRRDRERDHVSHLPFLSL